MDDPTVDKILGMITDRVIPEYMAERGRYPDDRFIQLVTSERISTANRIWTEIMVMADRLPAEATF